MEKTTVIFDMDGVLFDSEKVYLDELIDFHQTYGIKLNYEICKRVIGVDRHLFDEIVYSWWNHSLPQKKVKSLLNDYYKNIKRDYVKMINPHVKELLEYLHDHHYKIALASSSSPKTIHMALSSSHIEHYFQSVISGNEFRESKPNPEIYLYTLKKLNSSKEETLIIEDSPSGIQAAIAAGIDVIALKDPYFSLNQSHAKIIIDDLREVIDYLQRRE